MADTAGAPGALARYAEKQADLFLPAQRPASRTCRVPGHGLILDKTILETFLKLGLRRIGDLYPCRRAPLARRFGDLPLTRIDQALGKIDEPIEPRRPPARFRTRLTFAEPIGRSEDIAAAPAACWRRCAPNSSRRASARAARDRALSRRRLGRSHAIGHQPAQPRNPS